MFYHLLAGKPPLVETRDRIQRLNIGRYRDIPPIGKYVTGLPHTVINIVNKAIAFDPDKRYPNYELLKSDLDKVEEAEGVLLKRNEILTNKDGEEEQATPAKRGVIQQEGEGKTVLLVDSRQKMQELLRAQLGNEAIESCLCRMPSVDCNDYKIVRDSLIVRSFVQVRWRRMLYRLLTKCVRTIAPNQYQP